MKTEEEIELSLVIPVYNEETNLSELLDCVERLKARAGYSFEVVVVDDCSRDGSPAILENRAEGAPWLRVTKTDRNLGMGGALLLGSRMARGDYLIWTMGDLSDRLEDVDAIHGKLKEGWDLVIASRAMEGGDYGELGRVKAGLSHAYSRMAAWLFGLPARDITNAFRGMRKTLLFSLDLKSRNFTISPEMSIKAHRAGARIAEIPTRYRYRQAGESSFKVFRAGWEYALLLRLRFASRPKGNGLSQ